MQRWHALLGLVFVLYGLLGVLVLWRVGVLG